MGDFLTTLGQWVKDLWPFRTVAPWERAGLIVFGKWRRELGPGTYPVVPWFMDVHNVSIAKAIIGTGRQDITLMNGEQLSFSATATARVIDVKRAVTTVDDYEETSIELLGSVLADKLSDVESERIEPASRRRLLSDLTRWANAEANEYGLELSKVRFTNFTRKAPVVRLLMDQIQRSKW